MFIMKIKEDCKIARLKATIADVVSENMEIKKKIGDRLLRRGWYMIRSMKEQGVSISEIPRRLGLSRTTVRRYLKSGKVLQYHRDSERSMIDQYNLTAVRIYEELRKKGFKGSYSLVKQYKRPMRTYRKILAVYRYETDP